MNKFKLFLFPFLFVVISLIVVKSWYLGQELIISSDLTFPLRPVYYFTNQLFYQWLPSLNGGISHTVAPSILFFHGLITLINFFTKNIFTTQFINYSFWIFLPALTMFILVNYLFDKEKNKNLYLIFIPLFYSLNLYRVIMFGDEAHVSIFAAGPLILYFIIRALNEKKLLKYAFLIALSSIIASGAAANPPMYAVFLLPPAIYIIAFLIDACLRKKLKISLLFTIKFLVLTSIASFLVNSYWLLPFLNNYFHVVFSGSLAEINLSDWSTGVSGITSIINILRMQGAWDWYSGFKSDFYVTYAANYQNNPMLLLLGFLLPILAFSALYFVRNRYTIFFTLITLVGVIFSQGSHPPFGSIFDFMTQHVPLFWMFRSTWYKFGFLVALGYSFLGGIFIVYTFNYLKKRFNKSGVLISYSFILLIIIGTLIYAYPLITGEKFPKTNAYRFLPTSHVKIPDYVYESANWINSQNESFRTFLFPSTPAFIYRWQFNGITDVTFYLYNKSQAYTANLVSATDKNFGIGGLTSQIYDGIYKNNFEDALALSGILSSRYLIQRNDIRYDFYGGYDSPQFVNSQLKSVNGLSSSNTFGEWNLYKLSDKYFLPLFYVPENLVYSESDTSSLGEILTSNNLLRQQVLFSDFINNRDNLNVKPLINNYVVKANCVLCQSNELTKLEEKIKMPFVQLLPDSPLYFIVRNNEEKQLALYKGLPDTEITLYLDLSSKRLIEMSRVLERGSKDNSETIVESIIQKYINFIETALSKTNDLGEGQRNEELIKIFAYLQKQGKFLDSLNNPDNISLDLLNNLSIFLNRTYEKVKSDIWMTSNAKDKKFIFNLNEDGSYKLTLRNSPFPPLKVLIDGKEYSILNDIALSKGLHKAELIYPEPENLSDQSPALTNASYTLNLGEKKAFPFKNFDYRYTYYIKFDYFVSEGKPSNVLVQDNDQTDLNGAFIRKIKSNLSNDGKWHTFEHTLTPNLGAKNAALEFYPSGFDYSQSVFTIRNLTVNASFVPQMILIKKVNPKYNSIPNITFTRINPTEYKVHIKNAQKSFILNFGENYDKEWKAYVIEGQKSKDGSQNDNETISYFNGQIKELTSENKLIDNNFFSTILTKPILEKNHLKTNGYANGWFIDKKGDYDIIIEYWPQRLFYLGIVVSGVSGIVFIIYLIFLQKKNEKN